MDRARRVSVVEEHHDDAVILGVTTTRPQSVTNQAALEKYAIKIAGKQIRSFIIVSLGGETL